MRDVCACVWVCVTTPGQIAWRDVYMCVGLCKCMCGVVVRVDVCVCVCGGGGLMAYSTKP